MVKCRPSITLLTLALGLQLGCGLPLPFLHQVADFLKGIKYVPPTSGIFAPSHSPPAPSGYVPEHTTTGQPPRKDGGQNIIFEEERWVRAYRVGKLFLLGTEDITRPEAEAWCRSRSAQLVEIRTSREHFALSNIVAANRNGLARFWLGIQTPFNEWEGTGRSVNWHNWVDHADKKNNDRLCAVFNGRNFNWEHARCHDKLGYRALCERSKEVEEKEDNLKSPSGPAAVDSYPDSGYRADDNNGQRCVVQGVRVLEDSWLNKLKGVGSGADCHAQCLKVTRCNIWSWNKVSKVCYLKEDDSQVVKDANSESGTTLWNLGCNRPVKNEDQSDKNSKDTGGKVEYCSCVRSTDTLSYLDPRALPFNEDDEPSGHLGRYVIHKACPAGKELFCSEDDQAAKADDSVIGGRPNITDCLVYDVRLSTGHALKTLHGVANSETCHAHCLTTVGCTHWTWRGDKPDKTCYLKPSEGRMMRRPGASSGTVLEKYGCRYKLIQLGPDQREEDLFEGEVCSCEKTNEADTTNTEFAGYIEPRSARQTDDEEEESSVRVERDVIGQGRIVNIDFESEGQSAAQSSYLIVSAVVGTNDGRQQEHGRCPLGQRRVCRYRETGQPQEWQYGLELASLLPQDRSQPDQSSLARSEAVDLTAHTDVSAVNFGEDAVKDKSEVVPRSIVKTSTEAQESAVLFPDA